MNLYTVIIDFEDGTAGVEQYEADQPEQALLSFANKAESLDGYDRQQIVSIISNRIDKKNLLTQIANEFKGFWLINFGADFIESENLASIFGGYVIQTDKEGPKKINN